MPTWTRVDRASPFAADSEGVAGELSMSIWFFPSAPIQDFVLVASLADLVVKRAARSDLGAGNNPSADMEIPFPGSWATPSFWRPCQDARLWGSRSPARIFFFRRFS